MAHLIVEQTFEKPLSDADHDASAHLLSPCLAAHGATWKRSYLSVDRLRMVCHFEAVDAEAVRASYRSAGLKFDRVWSAELYATT
jgi:hypothetical protein